LNERNQIFTGIAITSPLLRTVPIKHIRLNSRPTSLSTPSHSRKTTMANPHETLLTDDDLHQTGQNGTVGANRDAGLKPAETRRQIQWSLPALSPASFRFALHVVCPILTPVEDTQYTFPRALDPNGHLLESVHIEEKTHVF